MPWRRIRFKTNKEQGLFGRHTVVCHRWSQVKCKAFHWLPSNYLTAEVKTDTESQQQIGYAGLSKGGLLERFWGQNACPSIRKEQQQRWETSPLEAWRTPMASLLPRGSAEAKFVERNFQGIACQGSWPVGPRWYHLLLWGTPVHCHPDCPTAICNP